MLKLSPDEAALLKAVCADRDADLPRLVYADYLDDHGRPERAEFIRLQCRVDKVGRERAESLLSVHGGEWRRELPKWAIDPAVTPDGGPEFVRGFVEEVVAAAAAVVRYAPQLLDRTPVRRLDLRHARPVWGDVVRCGWLGEVPKLVLLGNGLTDADGVALAGADWLGGTRSLDLWANDLRDPAARALAGCRRLTKLRHLGLGANKLTLAGVQALAASPYLTGLRALDLSANRHLVGHRPAVRRLFAGRLRLTLEADD